MKTSHAAALAAVSVLITVAVEETRITSLRAKSESASNSSTPSVAAAKPAAPQGESAAAPARTKSQSRPEVADTDKKAAAAPPADEELATTVRKMWDNPAGKSMMNQGVKMAVAVMYQDFIDGMEFSKEETDYFKNLLGREMAGQQELGMKLMAASPEERKTLMDEQEKTAKQNEEDIRKFLNNEEDFKKYTEYKNRLPEHQQLDGIRAVMNDKGVPLDADSEKRLVDAMYTARTTSGAPDLSGAKGLEELSKGNITDTFEKTWTSQQEALNKRVSGILSPEQMTAFSDYQKQMKEMQLMGLKMAEKMMGKPKADESNK